jgi:hypothetical protein
MGISGAEKSGAKLCLLARVRKASKQILPPPRRRPASRLPTIPLWPLGDIVLEVLHLFGPAPFIAAERFQTAVTGKLVEAGLGEHQ